MTVAIDTTGAASIVIVDRSAMRAILKRKMESVDVRRKVNESTIKPLRRDLKSLLNFCLTAHSSNDAEFSVMEVGQHQDAACAPESFSVEEKEVATLQSRLERLRAEPKCEDATTTAIAGKAAGAGSSASPSAKQPLNRVGSCNTLLHVTVPALENCADDAVSTVSGGTTRTTVVTSKTTAGIQVAHHSSDYDGSNPGRVEQYHRSGAGYHVFDLGAVSKVEKGYRSSAQNSSPAVFSPSTNCNSASIPASASSSIPGLSTSASRSEGSSCSSTVLLAGTTPTVFLPHQPTQHQLRGSSFVAPSMGPPPALPLRLQLPQGSGPKMLSPLHWRPLGTTLQTGTRMPQHSGSNTINTCNILGGPPYFSTTGSNVATPTSSLSVLTASPNRHITRSLPFAQLRKPAAQLNLPPPGLRGGN
ncbi:unnamed protein product [Amoebophrya sp. A25]|nr:unnamed protein product [Amoebophrya sp. A25]|eukprot:GSA25T00000986001.1